MEDLQEGLPGAAGEAAREALREAERNMGDARDGLEQGETADALDRQADAIDNLREGMREMGEDLRRAEAQGGGQQGQVDGETTAENGRDPLGRPIGSRGSVGSNENLVPDADCGRPRPRAARRDPPPLRRPVPPAARARLPAPAARLVLMCGALVAIRSPGRGLAAWIDPFLYSRMRNFRRAPSSGGRDPPGLRRSADAAIATPPGQEQGMGADIIDGKAFAAGLRARVADRVARRFAAAGVTPGLAVVLVGDDPASAGLCAQQGHGRPSRPGCTPRSTGSPRRRPRPSCSRWSRG